jgi:hypothetical protein
MNDMSLITAINMAIRLLAARMLSVVSLLMVFGLACWAMYVQTPPSLIVAGGFAILIFLPILHKDGKQGDNGGEQSTG